MHNWKNNSHDFLFLCQLLKIWAASLSCVCWEARRRAGLCPLPESKKNVSVTEMNYRHDKTPKWNTVDQLPTLSLELILAPQDSRYSTMLVWPVLVATCSGVLYNCSVDIDVHCDCVIWMHIHIQTYKGPTANQYNSIFTETEAFVSVQIKCKFTISLTFRSAPWLFRAWTTPRLPPLQAQCMALASSWNTVGGRQPVSSAGFRSLEGWALVCEDNEQRACASYSIFKVDISSFF